MPDAAISCLSSALLEIHASADREAMESIALAGANQLSKLHDAGMLSDAGYRQLTSMLEAHRSQRAAQLELSMNSTTANAGPLTSSSPIALLSPREAEVLGWVAQGKRDKDIAELLGISAKTVSKHLENILEKLQVEHRTAAAACLLRPVPVPGPVEAPLAQR